MSHKETIINEIKDLFRAPTALLYNDEVYKVCSWGSCKSYLRWPTGEEPEGWDELEEDTEFFIGRAGTRFLTFVADNPMYIKLYSAAESRIEECVDNICYELDLDNYWDEVAS